MKKKVFQLLRILSVYAIVISLTQSLLAQTSLTYGDVLVVGWNNNLVGSTRQLQFVLLKSVSPGTVLKISSAGFNSSSASNSTGNGRVTAGISKWTNTTGSTIAAGTVVTIGNNGSSAVSDIGTMSTIPSSCGCGANGSPYVQSTSGGRFLFYYGGTTDATSTDFSNSTTTATFNGTPISFLGFQGIQTGYTAWITSGTAGNFLSYLPSDLSTYNLFFAGNAIGGYYTGPRSAGTVASYSASILNPSNWSTVSGSGSTAALDSTYFTFGTTIAASTPSFTGTDTISVMENSSTNPINTRLAAIDTDLGNTEIWSIVANPLHGTLSGFPHSDTSTGAIITPTGLTYTPTASYFGLDTFAVRVFNGTNADTIQIHVMVVHSTGVPSINAAGKVSIYPNPTASVVHIDAATKVNVTVMNTAGKTLLRKKEAKEINLSDLAEGIYIIQVYNESGLLLKSDKVVKNGN